MAVDKKMQEDNAMDKKIDWKIHLVANGVECEECGKTEDGFLPYMCNAHTHGMDKYNHLDFQIVLMLKPEVICGILNTFGLLVQSGKIFKDGDSVSEIINKYDVRLKEFEETGRKVLRIILPDEQNRFPGDEGCEAPYSLQTLTEEQMCKVPEPTMKIRIYQIEIERDIHRVKFMDSSFIKKHYNGNIPADLYECIYDGEIKADDVEDVFIEFNSDKPRPKEYTGHSLSVSDVVEVIEDGGSKFYICDPYGFTEIEFKKRGVADA